jgi:hypothetical protein
MEAYNIVEEADQFSLSKQKFESLVLRLSSEETSRMDHSALESLVEREGREILRQLYQDHLDLRASKEQKVEKIQGSDGQYRNHRREGETRKLRVIFGDVEVTRIRYEGRGMNSLKPLDGELNLPGGLCSYGVQRHLVNHAIKMSFEATGEQMDSLAGVHVSKRVIEKDIQNAAQDFDAFYRTEGDEREKEKECSDDLMVLTSDGKGMDVMGPSEPEASDNVVPLRPKRTRPKNKRAWASLEKDADVVMTSYSRRG